MTKNVKITISAVDKTKKAISSTQKGLSTLKKSVFNLKTALLGLGAGALLISIARISSRFEDLRDSLASVTGSIENGKQAFNFISDFATRTQFGVEELTRSFITLKASGIEPTEKLLRVFTDTAAVTTDQLGTLDALTRVFSRGVQGGLGLEELNQIADRGVPIFKILEEQLGITRLEISKFGQSTSGAALILDALQTGLNKEFGGATETKLDNLSIATSNLQIALATAADQFGEAGFTGALTDAAVKLTDFITKNEEGIKIAGEYAGEIVDNLAEAFITLGQFIGQSRTELLEFLDALGFDVEPQTIEDFKDAIARQNEEVDKARSKLELHAKLTSLAFASNLPSSIKAQETHTAALVEAQAKLTELQNSYFHLINLTNTSVEATTAETVAIMENTVAEEENAKAKGLTLVQIHKANEARERFMARQKSMTDSAIALNKLEEEKKQEGLKQTGQALKDFAAEGAKRSKKMFRLQQAVQIGEAIMNTYAGATKALATLPPPFSFAVAALTVATGLAQVANIRSQQPPAQFGGVRQANSPFLVGEKGAELFTPAHAGTVTPNHQLGDVMGATHVTFNINTVDAKGFGALLDTRKAQIVNMINSARNQKGQSNIV